MKTLFSNAVMQIMAAVSIISTIGCICIPKKNQRKETNTLAKVNEQEEIDFFQY